MNLYDKTCPILPKNSSGLNKKSNSLFCSSYIVHRSKFPKQSLLNQVSIPHLDNQLKGPLVGEKSQSLIHQVFFPHPQKNMMLEVLMMRRNPFLIRSQFLTWGEFTTGASHEGVAIPYSSGLNSSRENRELQISLKRESRNPLFIRSQFLTMFRWRRAALDLAKSQSLIHQV